LVAIRQKNIRVIYQAISSGFSDLGFLIALNLKDNTTKDMDKTQKKNSLEFPDDQQHHLPW